eukprot:Em0003g276a
MTVGSIVLHIGGCGGGDGMTGIKGLEKSVEDFERSWSEERRDLVTMKKALSDRAGVTKDPLKSAKHFGRVVKKLRNHIAREVILRGTPDNIEDAVKKALDVERVMHYVEKQETEVMKQKNSGMIRHKRYWNKLLSGWKHWNQDCMVIANSASSAVGANGDSLDVIGCIELAVVLDTLNVKHSFIVVKRFTVECILGIDSLSEYGAVIDCK